MAGHQILLANLPNQSKDTLTSPYQKKSKERKNRPRKYPSTIKPASRPRQKSLLEVFVSNGFSLFFRLMRPSSNDSQSDCCVQRKATTERNGNGIDGKERHGRDGNGINGRQQKGRNKTKVSRSQIFVALIFILLIRNRCRNLVVQRKATTEHKRNRT